MGGVTPEAIIALDGRCRPCNDPCQLPSEEIAHVNPYPAIDTLSNLYRCMVRIRAFENAAEIASQGGVSAYGQSAGGSAQVRGPLHLSTGQEAVPAGVCAHLSTRDTITSTHRGHGHTLAKGADLGRMMAELFGKASGFNGGKGGSMHIADFSVACNYRNRLCGDALNKRNVGIVTDKNNTVNTSLQKCFYTVLLCF